MIKIYNKNIMLGTLVYKYIGLIKCFLNIRWYVLGYHLWNADVRTDDNPIEANLGFTCRKDGEYIGNESVNGFIANGVTKKYSYFTLEDKVCMNFITFVT